MAADLRALAKRNCIPPMAG